MPAVGLTVHVRDRAGFLIVNTRLVGSAHSADGVPPR
jgi:hypothetical protein